jgi:hypothetical protein
MAPAADSDVAGLVLAVQPAAAARARRRRAFRDCMRSDANCEFDLLV